MKALRPVLVVLVLLAPLGLLAAPAQAVGENCVATRLAERCAEVTGRDQSVTGEITAVATGDRVRVRVARATLQRRTADGWVGISTVAPTVVFTQGSFVASANVPCADAPAGRYRATGTVKWKVGPRGTVRTGRITSDPVRRLRVCG